MARKGKLSSLKGGEVLRPANFQNMPRAVIDPRYYPLRDRLDQNISTDYAEYQKHPVKNINSNLHEWEVDKASTGFIDLKNSYIVVRHKIQKDGADLTDATDAVYKQNLSLLMYQDKKIYLNNREVNDQHDLNLSPYSDLHKICLTEEYGEAPHLLTNDWDSNAAIPKADNTSVIAKGDKRSMYEDIYDIGTDNLESVFTQSATLSWKAQAYWRFNASSTGVQTVIRPRDGVWQQPYFLPPDTQIRLRFQVTPDEKIISTSKVNITNEFLEADLYLRRVYPNQNTMESIIGLTLQRPRVYPVIHNRCTYFTLNQNVTSLNKTGLLSGSKPSVIVVQFVKASSFIGNLDGTNSSHPFSAGQYDYQTTSGPKNPLVSVRSLYVKVGSKRYPRNFELGTESNNMTTDIVNYEEYLSCCKSTTNEVIKPFLSPASKSMQLFFVNVRENNETMYDKVDEPTGLDSIDLNVQFNSSIGANDIVCVVSALSNGAVTMTPDGNVDIVY